MQALKRLYRVNSRHVLAINQDQISPLVKDHVFLFFENRYYLVHELWKSVERIEIYVDEFIMLNHVIRDLLLNS